MFPHIPRYDMEVTIVFDGAALPAKRVTEEERAKSRKDAFDQACRLEEEGKIAEANTFYARSVDVCPEMAYEVAVALRSQFPQIKVLVAPYEADAQLAYLSRQGLVDIILSEDSDLLVYGCKRVLYKLDSKSGIGRVINCGDILSCPGIDRLSWATFQFACIIAGCDYIGPALLRGVSLRAALKIAAKLEGYMSQSGEKILSDNFFARFVLLLSMEGFDLALAEFIGPIKSAWETFHYQTVFCPTRQKLVSLTDILVDSATPSFLGEMYDDSTAAQVAACIVHPDTKQVFVPRPAIAQTKSQWIQSKPSIKKRKLPSPEGPLVRLWGSKTLIEQTVIVIEDDVVQLEDDTAVEVIVEQIACETTDLTQFAFGAKEMQNPSPRSPLKPTAGLPDLSQFIFTGN